MKWILIIWCVGYGNPNDIETVGSFSLQDDCESVLKNWEGLHEAAGGYCLQVDGIDL